ncbi:hypothetical protein [Desulfamplus magnetovallimortis]|uniref:hypothetical protein n=1 Tax=Desulfamplus magnetovallimortis TaxID=1246637 RepID=UPI00111B2D51|nr:hypothetical protein [Desulfamplus magnetovallimortis]
MADNLITAKEMEKGLEIIDCLLSYKLDKTSFFRLFTLICKHEIESRIELIIDKLQHQKLFATQSSYSFAFISNLVQYYLRTRQISYAKQYINFLVKNFPFRLQALKYAAILQRRTKEGNGCVSKLKEMANLLPDGMYRYTCLKEVLCTEYISKLSLPTSSDLKQMHSPFMMDRLLGLIPEEWEKIPFEYINTDTPAAFIVSGPLLIANYIYSRYFKLWNIDIEIIVGPSFDGEDIFEEHTLSFFKLPKEPFVFNRDYKKFITKNNMKKYNDIFFLMSEFNLSGYKEIFSLANELSNNCIYCYTFEQLMFDNPNFFIKCNPN